MNPRRLHKLTIFSMRWASAGVLIIFATDEHRLTQIQTRELDEQRSVASLWNQWKRDDSQLVPPSVLIRENLWLSLRFDLDLGFYRICNETLLVRAMIHLLDFLRRWLLLAGEFETLPQRHPGDG